MKVDKIIKNAKIFTSNQNKPQATALAVKFMALTATFEMRKVN